MLLRALTFDSAHPRKGMMLIVYSSAPAGPELGSFFHGFLSVFRGKRREDVVTLNLPLPLYLLLLFRTSWAVGSS